MRALKSRRPRGTARLPASRHTRRHGQRTSASPLACPTAASASVNGSSTRPSSPSRRSATTVRSASRCCLAGIFRCTHLFNGDGRRGPGSARSADPERAMGPSARGTSSRTRARVAARVVSSRAASFPSLTRGLRARRSQRTVHVCYIRPRFPDGTLAGVRRSRALRLTSNPPRDSPDAHRDGRIHEGPLQARGRRTLGALRPTPTARSARSRGALDTCVPFSLGRGATRSSAGIAAAPTRTRAATPDRPSRAPSRPFETSRGARGASPRPDARAESGESRIASPHVATGIVSRRVEADSE